MARGVYVVMACKGSSLLIASTLVATSACGAPPASSGGKPPRAVDTAPAVQPATAPGVRPGSTVAAPAALLEAIRTDAATALGLDRAALEVVRAEAVTWADGGLGCARPDEMVLQVLTPGYRVVLQVVGSERLLEYHSDRRGYFRRCPTASLVSPGPPGLPDR